MTEELFEEKAARGVGDYWDIIVRRRWWIIGPLFFGFLLVFASAWIIPAKYTSQALILVEQQKVPPNFVAPNVQVDLQERLQSITQQVLSRTRLLSIIQTMKLYQSDANSPDDQVDDMRKDIKIDLVQTSNGREQMLTAFKINYSASKPEVAQQVTTQLASFFIDENVKQSQQQSQQTTNFLDTQLKATGEQLAAIDAKVRAFQAAHNGELPSQLQSNLQILSGTQSQLQASIAAHDRAMQQQEYLNSLMAQYQSIGVTDGGVLTNHDLEQQLDNMRAALADLRTKYTDDHPDIKKLKAQIAETEKLQKDLDAEKREASRTDATAGQASAMTPYLQLQGQIKSNKMEIQRLEAEIQRLQASVNQYQARLNASPMVEQQLGDLMRDQEQLKQAYDNLMQKTTMSSLATNLQKEQQGEQFRIIDPPSLPDKPSFPDRFKFSLAGVGVGFVLALLFGAGTELMDDRIRSEIDLAEATTLPVLVEIPPLPTAQEVSAARWRPYYALAAAIATAIIIPFGVLYAFLWG